VSEDTNTVALTGTIDSEIEIKYLDNGMAIAEFTLMMVGYKGKEKFCTVKCFKDKAERVAAEGAIGSRVSLTGEVDGRKWLKPGSQKFMVFMNILAHEISVHEPSMGTDVDLSQTDDVPF